MTILIGQSFTAPKPPVPDRGSRTRRVLILESLDRTRRIPLDGSTGWYRLPGAEGLEMAPRDVVTEAVPGVDGSILREVRTLQRPIFVPIFTTSRGDPILHQQMLDDIRSLVDDETGQFRLIGKSGLGTRELTVVYVEGLEGAGGVTEVGTFWRKLGLRVLACDPWPTDPPEAPGQSITFEAADETDDVWLSAVTDLDTTNPWPRALSSSQVIGMNMNVRIPTQVPVWPVLELDGPMDSFAGSMDTGWSVEVPTALLAGQRLTIVSHPRSRSIRLDGVKAAGRVARGSRLEPFFPDINVLDVVAPGTTSETSIHLSWSNQYRSMW